MAPPKEGVPNNITNRPPQDSQSSQANTQNPASGSTSQDRPYGVVPPHRRNPNPWANGPPRLTSAAQQPAAGTTATPPGATNPQAPPAPAFTIFGGGAQVPQSTSALAVQQPPASVDASHLQRGTPFPFEDISNDDSAALGIVTQYAEKMAADEQARKAVSAVGGERSVNAPGHGYSDGQSDVPCGGTDKASCNVSLHEPSEDDVKLEKSDRSLRTSFGQIGNKMNVATNYLHINLKNQDQKIYVYNIEMVLEKRRRHDGGEPDKILLKDGYCRQYLFEYFYDDGSHSRSLRDFRGSWVTDYNTIWSVKELFLTPVPGSSNYVQPSILPKRFVNRRTRDIAHKSIDIVEMTIEAGPLIDISLPVHELFRNQTQTPSRDDDPAILVRGLNAFITQPARSWTAAGTPIRTQKSANKFFWTNRNYPLDVYKDRQTVRPPHNPIMWALEGYCASVRPGAQHLLLNVNTALSPFFQPGITVQEFHNRLLKTLLAHELNYRNGGPMQRSDVKFRDTVLKSAKV